jgi:hypothetical protein
MPSMAIAQFTTTYGERTSKGWLPPVVDVVVGDMGTLPGPGAYSVVRDLVAGTAFAGETRVASDGLPCSVTTWLCAGS